MMFLIAACFVISSVFSVTCSAFTPVPTYRWSQTPHFTIKEVCECVCMLVCHPSIL